MLIYNTQPPPQPQHEPPAIYKDINDNIDDIALGVTKPFEDKAKNDENLESETHNNQPTTSGGDCKGDQNQTLLEQMQDKHPEVNISLPNNNSNHQSSPSEQAPQASYDNDYGIGY